MLTRGKFEDRFGAHNTQCATGSQELPMADLVVRKELSSVSRSLCHMPRSVVDNGAVLTSTVPPKMWDVVEKIGGQEEGAPPHS